MTMTDIARNEAIYSLRITREVLAEQREALKQCQTVAPSLLTGEQAVERLKDINTHVYSVLRRVGAYEPGKP